MQLKNQASLSDYLKGSRKKGQKANWLVGRSNSTVWKLQKGFGNAALLTRPDVKYELALFVDASDFTIGSVVQQLEENGWRPIGFY